MLYHIITMTSQWVQWRLKSTGSWLFTQPFIQALIKDNNIKALRHWPLSGESGLAVFQNFHLPCGANWWYIYLPKLWSYLPKWILNDNQTGIAI